MPHPGLAHKHRLCPAPAPGPCRPRDRENSTPVISPLWAALSTEAPYL